MSRRRSSASQGFALAEALVSLAIAAMTIALLTGSTWGLRQAMEARSAMGETRSVDWLSARRAVYGWVTGLSADGRDLTGQRIIGSATTMRMVVDPVASGQTQPFVAELHVTQDEGIYRLLARRYLGRNDARLSGPYPQETVLVQTDDPMRLIYLTPRVGATELVWRYEIGDRDGLPEAIGLEVGAERVLTVPIFATISATCLSGLGVGGLEEPKCELR